MCLTTEIIQQLYLMSRKRFHSSIYWFIFYSCSHCGCIIAFIPVTTCHKNFVTKNLKLIVLDELLLILCSCDSSAGRFVIWKKNSNPKICTQSQSYLLWFLNILLLWVDNLQSLQNSLWNESFRFCLFFYLIPSRWHNWWGILVCHSRNMAIYMLVAVC